MIGIYTCLGACNTGIAAAEACIRLWKELDGEVKVSCLPALAVPVESVIAQQRKADKRILIPMVRSFSGWFHRISAKSGIDVQ